MTSRPARPRTLLDFINRPTLKGVAPVGNLKRVFTGKSGQNRKKNFESVMYASETIQNCKNPTGHIDTLSHGPDKKESNNGIEHVGMQKGANLTIVFTILLIGLNSKS